LLDGLALQLVFGAVLDALGDLRALRLRNLREVLVQLENALLLIWVLRLRFDLAEG
jgi:hypothetical protein